MSPRAHSVEREPIPLGTLDMFILRTLAAPGAPQLHGFEIADAIQRASRDVLQVEEGSLYPCLQRMLAKDWLSAEWGRTADNRRARYYRVTAAGRRQLERQMRSYRRVSEAIALILQTA